MNLTKANIKNKLKEFFTNQTILVCIILTLIYFLSGYYKWLEIGLPIIAFICFLTFSIQNGFCIFLYLHCFTLSNIGYDSCFVATIICYAIALFIKYIIGLKKQKFKIQKSLLIALSVFLAVSFALSFLHKLYYGGFIYLTYIPICYLIFAMRKEFDICQGINYMAVGLFVSCALAAFSLILPAYQYAVIYDSNRFMGFINHPNYLYMRALFILSYYMYRYLAKQLSHLKFILIYFLSAIIVLATLSKTGIVLLVVMSLLFIILYLKQDFKHNIKVVGIFALLFLILSLIGLKFIVAVFKRFASNDGNIINSLLTGRDDIWLDYLKAIVKNPFVFLFGHGLVAEEVFIVAQQTTRASHNLYIFLMYRFGLIGLMAIGYIIYLFIKATNKTNPKFIASLPLIWFLLESLCDNTFKCYNFSYLILSCMILFLETKEKELPKDSLTALKIEQKKE